MHGENFLVNDRCNGQTVEAVGKGLPKLDVIPSLALIIKAVDAVDRSTFVIASQDKEIFRVLDLVGKEQADSFERLLASIDIVPQEQIICLRRESTILEQTEEIVILAVNITADLS